MPKETIDLSTNVIEIEHLDISGLLNSLGHLYFYPLADQKKWSKYHAVIELTEDAFEPLFQSKQTLRLNRGVRAYFHYGNAEYENKGLFLASRDPAIFRSIKPSSAFGEGIHIRDSLIKVNDSLLAVLIKLFLRDEKSLVVHPFGRILRDMGRVSENSRLVADFNHEFRRRDDSGFTLRIQMATRQYIEVKEPEKINPGTFYLVGVMNRENQCFLLTGSRAKTLFSRYPIRYPLDGRKDPQNWIFGTGKKDNVESGQVDDKVTMLSRFIVDTKKKLQDAGCIVETRRRKLGQCDLSGKTSSVGKVKRYVKNQLNVSVNRVFVPPVALVLSDGILPVVDLRDPKDRSLSTAELIQRLTENMKSKNMDLYFDEQGRLRQGIRLVISNSTDHEVAIAILHEKDFYKNADDPYDSLRSWQHLTVENALDKSNASLFPVTLRELAIKQMLMSNRPWRRFVLEPLWDSLSGVKVCASGKPGKKYAVWRIVFPNEDQPLISSTHCGLHSCWHEDYLEHAFLPDYEKGDKNHHYAWIRKDDVVIMVRLGGVAEHLIYDESALQLPFKARFKVMGAMFAGVHYDVCDQELFYVTGGVYPIHSIHGAKRHPSAFSAWVLEGSVEKAMTLIESWLYPHSRRLGDYPARPFPIGFAKALLDMHSSTTKQENT